MKIRTLAVIATGGVFILMAITGEVIEFILSGLLLVVAGILASDYSNNEEEKDVLRRDALMFRGIASAWKKRYDAAREKIEIEKSKRIELLRMHDEYFLNVTDALPTAAELEDPELREFYGRVIESIKNNETTCHDKN